MQVRVDTRGVVDAAAQLRVQGDSARALAAPAKALGTGLADRRLGAAVATLGDVCGDVLEVAALDLWLLAEACRAGAQRYEAVEGAVTGTERERPR